MLLSLLIPIEIKEHILSYCGVDISSLKILTDEIFTNIEHLNTLSYKIECRADLSFNSSKLHGKHDDLHYKTYHLVYELERINELRSTITNDSSILDQCIKDCNSKWADRSLGIS